MKHKQLTLLAAGTLLLASCGYEARNEWQRFTISEKKIVPEPEYNPNLINSHKAGTYINADGTGIAIPAKEAYDLYISPFAPTSGYVQSKLPAGSAVHCPYTGKILILGSRDEIADKEIR